MGKASAVATVAAGGGPENPVTDVAAAGQLAGGAKRGPKADQSREPAPGKGKGKGKGKGGRAFSWAWSDNRKLLMAEFVVCVAVLGAGTLASPEDSKHDVERAMIKGSALAGVFFVLALVSSAGGKSARAANAIGTLITATYVLTSADVHNLLTWMEGFFLRPSAGAVVGPDLTQSSGEGSEPGGDVAV